MSQKVGRPKAEHPKNIEIKARIDSALNQRLLQYCARTRQTRTGVIRKGITTVLEQADAATQKALPSHTSAASQPE